MARHEEGWLMHSPALLEFLRKHIDALLALSHEARDRTVAAKIRDLADECRIVLSLMDISNVAAGLNQPLPARAILDEVEDKVES
jgi:hypothetical protein